MRVIACGYFQKLIRNVLSNRDSDEEVDAGVVQSGFDAGDDDLEVLGETAIAIVPS